MGGVRPPPPGDAELLSKTLVIPVSEGRGQREMAYPESGPETHFSSSQPPGNPPPPKKNENRWKKQKTDAMPHAINASQFRWFMRRRDRAPYDTFTICPGPRALACPFRTSQRKRPQLR